MTALATLAVLLAGFSALAISMRKHHHDLFGTPPRHARLLRCLGWTLLATALVPAMAGQGASIGIVLWFGIATVAVPTVAMLLTYRAMWLRQ